MKVRKAGANGVAYGRNIFWQADDPARVSNAFRVVYGIYAGR